MLNFLVIVPNSNKKVLINFVFPNRNVQLFLLRLHIVD